MKHAGTRRKAAAVRAGTPTPGEIERKFSQLVEVFSTDPDVSRGGGKGFGSGALKVNGRIFAMLSSNAQFVVKLPEDRASELVASGKRCRFEPRRGRVMKKWVVLGDSENWTKLAQEARDFVKHGYSRTKGS